MAAAHYLHLYFPFDPHVTKHSHQPMWGETGDPYLALAAPPCAGYLGISHTLLSRNHFYCGTYFSVWDICTMKCSGLNLTLKTFSINPRVYSASELLCLMYEHSTGFEFILIWEFDKTEYKRNRIYIWLLWQLAMFKVKCKVAILHSLFKEIKWMEYGIQHYKPRRSNTE